MPDVTFMSWNIQDFGAGEYRRGQGYVPMCNFIAYVVQDVGADILAIMELKSTGVAHLPTLCNSLNTIAGGDWYYDWIKGAKLNDPANNAADLNWDDDHSEGYALLWNDASNAAFTMQPARGQFSNGVGKSPGHHPPNPPRIPQHALGLVFQGRTQGMLVDTSGGNNHFWFNAPAFDPANPPNNWSQLNFALSNTLTIGKVSATKVRRPCYFVLNLQNRQAPNNTPQGQLVPVVIYHSSSNERSRRLNTQLSGYSQQLYQVDSTPTAANPTWVTAKNAIIAGDFNINANATPNDPLSFVSGGVEVEAYMVFTKTFANRGSNSRTWLTSPYPQTTVQLYRPITQRNRQNARTGQTVDDYFSLSIDHIFYRFSPPPNANINPVTPAQGNYPKVYDLITNVLTGGNLTDAHTGSTTIQDFWHDLQNELGALNHVNNSYANYPNRDQDSRAPTRTVRKTKWNNDRTVRTVYQTEEAVIGDLLDWDNLVQGLTQGEFDQVNGTDTSEDARTAAEFIRKFITDHLPIVFRFNFT